jgi:pilus assembly protein Flp/PilA
VRKHCLESAQSIRSGRFSFEVKIDRENADQGNVDQETVTMTMFSRFMNDESGATAIEYGLIAAIIGVGCIVALDQVKTDLNTVFTKVSTELAKAPN